MKAIEPRMAENDLAALVTGLDISVRLLVTGDPKPNLPSIAYGTMTSLLNLILRQHYYNGTEYLLDEDRF